MSVTATSLKAAHPEFSRASDALVTDRIDDAEAELSDEVVPASKRDKLVELLACDLLARSPFGVQLKLVQDDNTTIYEREFLKRAEAIGRSERVSP